MMSMIAIQESPAADVFQIGTLPIILLAGLVVIGMIVFVVIIARRGRDRLDTQENLYQQQFTKQKAQIEEMKHTKGRQQDQMD